MNRWELKQLTARGNEWGEICFKVLCKIWSAKWKTCVTNICCAECYENNLLWLGLNITDSCWLVVQYMFILLAYCWLVVQYMFILLAYRSMLCSIIACGVKNSSQSNHFYCSPAKDLVLSGICLCKFNHILSSLLKLLVQIKPYFTGMVLGRFLFRTLPDSTVL